MLAVYFTQVNLGDGEFAQPSWTIEEDSHGANAAVLWGFARQVDAEIAMRFMLSLPIDWSLSSDALWAQVEAAGYSGREDLHRAACERLMW